MDVDYLTQLMAWNPEAPSFTHVKKGVKIPSHWALQYQFLFQPQLNMPSSSGIQRYPFRWVEGFRRREELDKESVSGDEKKVYEIFQKMVSEMIESSVLKTLKLSKGIAPKWSDSYQVVILRSDRRRRISPNKLTKRDSSLRSE